MINFYKVSGRSLFYDQYVYMDTKEYLADQVFINDGVKVKFTGEFRRTREESKYVIVKCKVLKKNAEKFKLCMSTLYNKMLLMGNNDYSENCKIFSDMSAHFKSV